MIKPELRQERVPHARWIEEDTDLHRAVGIQHLRAAGADLRIGFEFFD